MGMSSYVLDCEDKFFDIVSDAVKESEHISEAIRSLSTMQVWLHT